VNYGAFLNDFKDAVDESVESYYAIARMGSKVTARQFQLFCERIEAPLQAAPPEVRRWFSNDWVDDVFRVREAVFNADRLREAMEQRLRTAGVVVRLGTPAARLEKKADGWTVVLADGSGLDSPRVYVCGYAGMNRLLADSGLPVIPLKQEWTEMSLVEVPEALRRSAVTVMCGPFFSLVPYPLEKGFHTLSHVRYTPLAAWSESDTRLAPEHPATPASRFPFMVRDAARYMPALRDLRHVDSIWQMKSILPASEVDDSRPILFRRDHGGPGLTCILGGKIDNVYDMQQELTLVPR